MTATPAAEGLDSGQQSRYSIRGKSPSMTAMTHQKARVHHTWAFALSADGSSYTPTSGNRKPGTERPQAGEGIWGEAALFNGIGRVLVNANRWTPPRKWPVLEARLLAAHGPARGYRLLSGRHLRSRDGPRWPARSVGGSTPAVRAPRLAAVFRRSRHCSSRRRNTGSPPASMSRPAELNGRFSDVH